MSLTVFMGHLNQSAVPNSETVELSCIRWLDLGPLLRPCLMFSV